MGTTRVVVYTTLSFARPADTTRWRLKRSRCRLVLKLDICDEAACKKHDAASHRVVDCEDADNAGSGMRRI